MKKRKKPKPTPSVPQPNPAHPGEKMTNRGCLLRLVSFALVLVGLKYGCNALLPVLKPTDPDCILFFNPATSLFMAAALIAFFGFFASYFVLACRTTISFVVVLFILLVVLPQVVYFYFFDDFFGISVKAGVVKFVYPWPRGDRVVSVSTISQIGMETAAPKRGSGRYGSRRDYPLYRFQIITEGKTLRSKWSADKGLIQTAMNAMEREKNAVKPTEGK